MDFKLSEYIKYYRKLYKKLMQVKPSECDLQLN